MYTSGKPVANHERTMINLLSPLFWATYISVDPNYRPLLNHNGSTKVKTCQQMLNNCSELRLHHSSSSSSSPEEIGATPTTSQAQLVLQLGPHFSQDLPVPTSVKLGIQAGDGAMPSMHIHVIHYLWLYAIACIKLYHPKSIYQSHINVTAASLPLPAALLQANSLVENS